MSRWITARLYAHCPPLWRLWTRYYCPIPIEDAYTARDCIERGWCGCDNAERFK